MDGLLLFAHGARDAAWARPFEEVARRIALQRPGQPLALAYLEFMQPTIETAAHELAAAQGCTRIHVVPMFLGTGGHVRRDIPPLLEKLHAHYGAAIEWRLHPALGDHDRVLDAMTAASLAWLDEVKPRMNLHQFRFVQEAARRNLNLTETAKALFTSQPGVSKAILELEEELGIDIFIRHGKRLRRITEPGQQVLAAIEIIMREVSNLKRIGEEYSKQDTGTLSIATTHTQARYVLPGPVAQLRRQLPHVRISLHQGNPDQVVRMLLDDSADLGLATESLSEVDGLVSLPCYEWQHVLVVPSGHPLAEVERISLEQLAAEPIVTYHPSFTGRTRIDRAFAARQLHPNIVLEAIDSDVIKTYVRLGMGLGIVAEMAVREDPPGGDLVSRPLGHLFGQNVTRIAFKRGAYLRNFVYSFAELLSDRLNRSLLERAMNGEATDFGI